MPIPELINVSAVSDLGKFDASVCVFSSFDAFKGTPFEAHAATVQLADKASATSVSFLPVDMHLGKRLILSPISGLDKDFTDVRTVAKAAALGVERAVQSGATQPAVLFLGVPTEGTFSKSLEVGVLGVLQSLYRPLQVREHLSEVVCEPVTGLGIHWHGPGAPADMDALLALITAIEEGKRVSRDIGGGDPERMAAPLAAEYIEATFEGVDCIKVDVISDLAKIEKEYPLAYAVGRASTPVERHHPRIVRVEYTPEGPVDRVVYISGKGITYDTGGADIKAGGIMAGMKRDKCGATSAAGFLKTVSILKPAGLKVIAYLGFVRNSVGSESYVADEVITGHAGRRVLVVNTDAEGRMVMADLLSHIRDEAKASFQDVPEAERPQIAVHTMATLTGHAVVAVGMYSIALDNAVAAKYNTARSIQDAGDVWGDCFEVSRLRPDDFAFIAPKTPEYDVLQCNTAPSSRTMRGHQFPMAFLTMASGLDAHGTGSKLPLAYTHLDIAGSAADGPVGTGKETGSAVTALCAHYLPQLK